MGGMDRGMGTAWSGTAPEHVVDARVAVGWDRLATSDASELTRAHVHLATLLQAARTVDAAGGHDPEQVACATAGCGFAREVDGDRLCTLAHQLAGVRDGDTPIMGFDGALVWFREALTGALDAVSACRRTAHPLGVCWFTTVAGTDGCAEVLRAAHRCS